MHAAKRKFNVCLEGESESEENDPKIKHYVIRILEKVQVDEAYSNKYQQELQDQYIKIGHKTFTAIFINCLKQWLKNDDKNIYANAGLKFMAKFATSFKTETNDLHIFTLSLFQWILDTVSLVQNVRARLCRFLCLLINSLGSNVKIDDNVFDEILTYLTDRLTDVCSSVRVQAIKALQRLQKPGDRNDVIMKMYLYHGQSDPSSDVRQAVITCIARTAHTIPVIVERLWDIDEKVRRHVIVQMSSYPVKLLKIKHRLMFLEQGLSDNSDSVRQVVSGLLIPVWFESYNKNYYDFLRCFMLDSTDDEIHRFRTTGHLSLLEMFKKEDVHKVIKILSLSTDEDNEYDKCMHFDKLTLESSLLWWSLIQYCEKDDKLSHYADTIIPNLTVFCSYVRRSGISCKETSAPNYKPG